MTPKSIICNSTAALSLNLSKILTGFMLFLAAALIGGKSFASDCRQAAEIEAIAKSKPKDLGAEFLMGSAGPQGGLDLKFWYLAKADRLQANFEITKIKKQKKFETDQAPLIISEELRNNWLPSKLSFVDFGSGGDLRTAKMYKLESLRQHFLDQMPTRYAEIAIRSVDALSDFEQFINWLQLTRAKVIEKMKADGIMEINNARISELYTDQVLAIQGFNNGFSIKKNGLPFDVTSFTENGFWKVLEEKKLFVDWTGIGLVARGSKTPHQARGHLLFMAYLAETVPGFADLISYVGKTKDKDGFWQYTTDNGASSDTALFSGYWIEAFGDYLNIRY